MPFAVDEDRMTSDPMKLKPGASPLLSLDVAKPPVKEIPYMDFPRAIYKHPVEPYYTVVHRNTLHEIVEEERIPTEHLTMVVGNADELKKALEDGWSLKPYIQQAPPDPKAALYAQAAGQKGKGHGRTEG